MTDPAPARTGVLPAAGRYSETALSGIYEISKIVTSPASLKVMLNNVVSVMSSFLDMRLATLALLDDKGDPEINVSASTEHELASGEDAEIPMAVIDQIVATATPLAVQNCALHPLFAGWKRLGRVEPGYVQTFIGVPIRVDNEVAGTLAIERVWKGTMDVRIDHDVRFLTMVANLLGQALKLHRVVAEDRERLMLEQARLAKELSSFKSPKSQAPKLSGILGKSRAIRNVTSRIEQVAKSNASVLIRGETGTGKELFARAIHELSSRKGKPFIKVNCAALPESVIESELFGHEKGAFTGAIATRKGRFELAHGGTIFLDEIGEISPAVPGQAAARAAGGRVRARRRAANAEGEFPAGLRHQPQPRRVRHPGEIPRRPLLPHQRRAAHAAALARARRRHPRACRALPAGISARRTANRRRLRARRRGGAVQVLLPRQRPRA